VNIAFLLFFQRNTIVKNAKGLASQIIDSRSPPKIQPKAPERNKLIEETFSL